MGVIPRIVTGRAYSFRAVHRLDGGAYPEAFHGHAYRLEVMIEDSTADALDQIVRDDVLPRLHGRVLDGRRGPRGPSTGEVLVEWIDEVLRASPVGLNVCAVLLRETGKNRFASARTEVEYV